ncbi:rhomboid family intramembrane serine protease [soil metagenome]|nr:rhomboid family intramembrane serine protease [Acidobacteriota bacterium]
MFPVSDVIPSRTTPYVTMGLIAVNTVAFFYEFRMTPGELQALVNSYGVVPAAAFNWPTLVTSLFLHAGWVHFLGNMLYLWIFGDNVEDRLGHAGFLLFYVCCGAVAASGHLVAHAASDVPLIGASGAVAGVMGAYFVLYPRSRVLTAVFLVVFLDLIEIPAVYFLGLWFLMQLFSGVGSIGADIADGTVAFWAHIAGFVAGALTGLLLRTRRGAAAGYWGQARQPGE